jgi:hypothetical protein
LCHGPAGSPQIRSNPPCTLPANETPATHSTTALNTLVVPSTRVGAENSRITASAEEPVRPMP